MRLGEFPERRKFEELIRNYSVVPCCRTLLFDMETPVSILGKIYRKDGAFLFESVEGGERWGRYSFLGVTPYAQVKVFRDRVDVLTSDGQISRSIDHRGDPLSVLRELMSRFTVPEISELPRFWGGFVGYFCYEMVSFFEPVPNFLPEEEPLAHLIVPQDLVIFDRRNHTVTLVTLFYGPSSHFPVLDLKNPYDYALERLDSLEELLHSEKPPTSVSRSVPIRLETPIPPEEFRSMVLRAKEYIRDGEAIQIVLSQPFVSPTAPDPWLLYRVQRFINPSPYLFYCNFNSRFLVGSSPETMVRLEHGVASVRPIAGTRPRGRNEQEDRRLADELIRDEKERAEHIMLVDLGRNDLGRIAETGSVQVTEYMTVERYSHVMHLVSHVQAHLKKGLDAWDVFKATFPAGTLTGAPKVRAMQLIAELEGRPRGPYGGAVGYVSFQGNMDLAITIRTAEIAKGEIKVQAGAGIVYDSDPEKERQETVHKAKAMERALSLISNGM
ncbi:anthranilate synthase component I family protein [Thermodesulforhabdus norvegica]|uniref:Anthranilate synthase component 1 n=1 Tax=Thermodesulforhabdus norvegica TaxID=39841 RepID=A0A1I4U6I1_9BACT|nr:anthranilate synthase component I family protein [Thermodesulforhabdus norvegica]SFM84557.1 anthranilate synthase, component I [Thermodesulforhabdus norvegica]